MKKTAYSILAAALILSLTAGCASRKERYAKTITSAQQYMASIAGTPTMSINGDWEDTAFASWGSPHFVQTKNKVIGNMGQYSVEGVIYGNKVYLAAISGGYLYYTITLEKVDANTLVGKYVSGFKPSKNLAGTSFILKRKALQNAI